MWKGTILRSEAVQPRYDHKGNQYVDTDAIQTRLKGMITSYVIKNFPGCQITAFAEVGQQDQLNIIHTTGKTVERGFYLRLKPIPDDHPGLVSLWALEDLSPAEIVTNKQLEYEQRSTRLEQRADSKGIDIRREGSGTDL